MKEIDNLTFFVWVEDELAHAGRVRFRVKGVSMYPLLRDGRDEVLLRNCNDGNLEIGDIALFKYGGVYILHRLRKRNGEELVFQGDNVLSRQERCCIGDVVGVVELLYRSGLNGEFMVLSPKSLKWMIYSALWRNVGIYLYAVASRFKRAIRLIIGEKLH